MLDGFMTLFDGLFDVIGAIFMSILYALFGN